MGANEFWYKYYWDHGNIIGFEYNLNINVTFSETVINERNIRNIRRIFFWQAGPDLSSVGVDQLGDLEILPEPLR